MPNKPLADWQKIIIMAAAPYRGNRSVAKKAECSVWAVRKYRNQMKDEGRSLDVGVTDEYGDPLVSEAAMAILDDVVADGLSQDRGRI
ncbi:hypothetical protein HUG10_21350 (plasmid) [Halorarum halophilum]|uniref:Uncharacterized protein n=1 Tax=Halorarum halophilum TaxID=2743090 RepID=A0A7D5KIM9_9EURY|nr:hypothetical protein [Halobaculum halophilum]QLG30136.1 hypothetical protein HUG10_21350 [Halobaculum halophilum]